ncbi:MAG: zinc ribbon domain-containing protein [Defluviitaleaceae bacterium]|nr:zinc ribbon domain-containing protein [Defluviitaleaceae bacterium]
MADIKTGIEKAVKAVAQGSGTFVKTTKLTLNLSSEENKLNTIYTQIGKSVHEIYKHGGSLGAMFDERYKEILELEARIADIRNRLEIAKGVVICPKCNANAKRGSVFCPKCGGNMGDAEELTEIPQATVTTPHIAPTPAPTPYIAPSPEPVPQPNPVPQGKTCGVCGSVAGVGERFCLSCGRAL